MADATLQHALLVPNQASCASWCLVSLSLSLSARAQCSTSDSETGLTSHGAFPSEWGRSRHAASEVDWGVPRTARHGLASVKLLDRILDLGVVLRLAFGRLA